MAEQPLEKNRRYRITVRTAAGAVSGTGRCRGPVWRVDESDDPEMLWMFELDEPILDGRRELVLPISALLGYEPIE